MDTKKNVKNDVKAGGGFIFNQKEGMTGVTSCEVVGVKYKIRFMHIYADVDQALQKENNHNK